PASGHPTFTRGNPTRRGQSIDFRTSIEVAWYTLKAIPPDHCLTDPSSQCRFRHPKPLLRLTRCVILLCYLRTHRRQGIDIPLRIHAYTRARHHRSTHDLLPPGILPEGRLRHSQ